MPVIECEVDGNLNQNVLFLPLGRTVRGAFEFGRIQDANRMQKLDAWAGRNRIPGQRIAIDTDRGVGYVREPLHADPELKFIIEQKRHMHLEAPEQAHANIHVPTWLFWMKRLVEDNLLKVKQGQLPDKIDGEPQRGGFTIKLNEQKPAADATSAASIAELKSINQTQAAQIGELTGLVKQLLADRQNGQAGGNANNQNRK